MTDNQEPESAVEAVFRHTLERHAGEAPSSDGLMDQVRARRTRSRRSWWAAGTATVAASATAAVLLAVNGLGATGATVAGPEPERDRADWRSESYQGIELRVPDAWAYGTTGAPPCLEDGGQPYVGRPGAVRDIACHEAVPELAKRVPYLWFDSTRPPGVVDRGHGWVEETRTVGGIRITAFTDDARLRERILDSARTVVGTDSYGCPTRHPVARDPSTRPSGPGLDATGEVESVSRCTYSLIEPSGSPLLAGSVLEGARARAIVDAVRAAPPGSDPNSPDSCSAGYSYGDEVTVLLVEGTRGSQEVVVRYGGCDHHGTDDGETERKLTREVLEPLLTGPHFPSSFDGSISALLGEPTGK